jgi:hypothetical protein
MSALNNHQHQVLGIAKTWAMKNLPGWSDECHRDLLKRYGARKAPGTARFSATTMTPAQIGAALADYEARGWPRQKTFKAGGEKKTVPPAIAHIVRLWGRLGQAGKLRAATRPALLAFCARQTGREVPNLDSLTQTECASVTEALKSWLARGE